MAKSPAPLTITSLRGGQNDTDPEHLLPDDQCVTAENVEFYFSALGERRNGCVPMSLTGSGIETSPPAAIVHLSQRFPTNDPNIGELWVIGATAGSSTVVAVRSNEESWTPVTPVDPIDNTVPYIYQITAQAYQNKHFFFYKSSDPLIDRHHVWDGTTLRLVGLKQPSAAPTAGTTGGGTYATARYFRIRYIERDVNGKILRRSEPSASVLFTPPGTGSGVIITRPALISEGETHWEAEGSADDVTYYRLATVVAATTTYTDSTASVLTYASNVLSEDIGQYLLIPNVRFGIIDGDRPIFAGHFTDKTKQSRVSWGPVSKDPGAGNDERLPLASLVDDYVELDNYEGGAITGLSQTVNGSFYIFKWSHIYQATRTGNAESAYDFFCISKSRGALPGSVVSGMDEYGQACIYFLDPLTGPSRLGVAGLQLIRGLRRTWTRINRLATGITSHGVYYPEKRQMHWWVAADGANYPNLKLILQVNESTVLRDAEVGRGWSLANGRIAEAYCSAIVNVEILGANGQVSTLARRPYIGLTNPDLLQQCDLLATDAGQDYVARIVTKPYITGGLLNRWGTMSAALLADASDVGNVEISCIRDFGLETNTVNTDLSADVSEDLVLKRFDNLVMSSAFSLQFQFSDPE